MAPSAVPIQRGPFLAGLAIVTGAALALEILQTRLLSVLTWYSLAFLVVALGLLGVTAGAVHVYLRPARYAPEVLPRHLADDALYFALAVVASYAVVLLIPLRIAPSATTLILFFVFAAVIAAPFFAAGAVTAAALTRAPFAAGRLYAFDLAGAAAGACSVPVLLRVLDGGTAILAVGVAAALGSIAFGAAAGDRRRMERALVCALVLSGVCAINHNSSHGLVPLWVKGRPEDRNWIAQEVWNSHSRVHVSHAWKGAPSLWGAGANCKVLPDVDQRTVVIDGDANTPLYETNGDPAAVAFLRCDVTSIVHALRPRGPVAIIGVGGSRDIQAALMFGHERVVGIELNDRLIEILQGPLGARTGVAHHPAVELVHEDGRSWLARTPERFTVVQAALVDTWAATGAGAHALAENGLYTLEAWRTFLGRLAPEGILSVSRWHMPGAAGETTRLVSLAVGALLAEGAPRPREHIAVIASGFVATVLVSRSPLASTDSALLLEAAMRSGFWVLAAPGFPDAEPDLTRFLDATSPDRLARVSLSPTLDLRPPTDDRPFFFQILRPAAWLEETGPLAGGTIEGNRLATLTVAWALVASAILCAAAVIAPLLVRARPHGRAGRRLSAALIYFGLIGAGFMLVEVALLLRFSLVLGHPTRSLVVVLASLVGGAGVGAWLSDRLPLDRGLLADLFPLGLAAVLAGSGLALPSALGALEVAQLGTRLVVAGAACACVGGALGLAFPAGLRVFRTSSDDETPWLWGINGVTGVVASSAAIFIASQIGISALLFVAALAYALAAPALALGRRSARDG